MGASHPRWAHTACISVGMPMFIRPLSLSATSPAELRFEKANASVRLRKSVGGDRDTCRTGLSCEDSRQNMLRPAEGGLVTRRRRRLVRPKSCLLHSKAKETEHLRWEPLHNAARPGSIELVLHVSTHSWRSSYHFVASCFYGRHLFSIY
jgi:hypothetical protein